MHKILAIFCSIGEIYKKLTLPMRRVKELTGLQWHFLRIHLNAQPP